jgi:hypothetical protein
MSARPVSQIAAHLGDATRGQIGAQLDRDCATVLRGMLDRGLVEKAGTGFLALNLYRATARAIAATGHDSLTSFQRFPADACAAAPAAEPGA